MPLDPGLDLQALQRFCELAAVGNFGRAASRLGMSQPGLSRVMRRLEKSLDVELIKRHSKGITLSEHGENLRAATTLFVKSIERIGELHRPSRTPNIVLVGMPLSLAPLVSVVLHKQLLSSGVDSSLMIVEMTSAELQQAVITGRVDAALLYDPPEIDELKSVPVATENLWAVFPPMWELPFSGASVSLRSLTEFPIILHSPAQSERRLLLAAEHRHGLKLTPLLELDNPSTLKAVVHSGLGCSVACHQVISDEMKRGSLVGFPLSHPALTMKLHISTASSFIHGGAARFAADTLQRTVSELIEHSSWPGAIRAC